MNNLFRGLIAGYGAHKLGGGCFSTVLIFLLLWWLLGMCGDAEGRPLPAQLDAAPPHVIAADVPPTADAAALPARWP
jgi:hypothetical protein